MGRSPRRYNSPDPRAVPSAPAPVWIRRETRRETCAPPRNLERRAPTSPPAPRPHANAQSPRCNLRPARSAPGSYKQRNAGVCGDAFFQWLWIELKQTLAFGGRCFLLAGTPHLASRSNSAPKWCKSIRAFAPAGAIVRLRNSLRTDQGLVRVGKERKAKTLLPWSRSTAPRDRRHAVYYARFE